MNCEKIMFPLKRTRHQIAKKLGTQKTAISRMENHAEDVRLSTIEKYVAAIGKKFTIKIA